MTTERGGVPICELCGLPAVCIDADLADPWYWCGNCCSCHDGNDAVVAHAHTHGITIPATRP